MRIGLTGIVYLILGVFAAKAHHYLANIDSVKSGLSAALAIALWPFILVFGLHFHVT